MVSKQKILIVDDDNNIAELISLYLTKECFDTMIVNDGCHWFSPPLLPLRFSTSCLCGTSSSWR